MPYSLSQINAAIHSDPRGYIEECDAIFQKKIQDAANKIARNMENSHIVLLSGPSGSGKTTTAMKIEEILDGSGVETHTVSMDNYFKSLDPVTAPRNREGGYDYESPFCLDIDLLNRHFAMLDRGETIHIPTFEFARQLRSATMSRPLMLEKNELAIFEGIHALNDIITGKNRAAFKLYIAARSNFLGDDGAIVFQHPWLRLARRIVRDAKFRGSGADFTLRLWENVRRGEKLYISPYKESADLLFDSCIPYELPALKPFLVPMLEALTPGEFPVADNMLAAFQQVEALEESYIAPNSLVREFIGGSHYSY